MNKCLKCDRPLPIYSNKKYCTHCKSKAGNLTGKIGGGLLLALPFVIKVIRKGKK